MKLILATERTIGISLGTLLALIIGSLSLLIFLLLLFLWISKARQLRRMKKRITEEREDLERDLHQLEKVLYQMGEVLASPYLPKLPQGKEASCALLSQSLEEALGCLMALEKKDKEEKTSGFTREAEKLRRRLIEERRNYNSDCTIYNQELNRFPTSLIAASLHLGKEEYIEAKIVAFDGEQKGSASH